MKIGFDAKRIFLNRSGLGNYGRNTLRQLSNYIPDNEYHLYTTRTSSIGPKPSSNLHIHTPHLSIDKLIHAYWRSKSIIKDLKRDKLDIYHGLSNELPNTISKTNIKSVVTIHDLIIYRYPELYKKIDISIYKNKFQKAIDQADKIIAISNQTKEDIITNFPGRENKIEVVYQGCNPIFNLDHNTDEIAKVINKYNLPKDFILFVGTIEERKNVLQIVKAIQNNNIDIPLYIIGKATKYTALVQEYIKTNKVKNIHILHGISDLELRTFYYLAKIFVYPSIFEGFGIPILEALSSGTPVITSLGSCFSEAGGKHTKYVNHKNPDEIGYMIRTILEDESIAEEMRINGLEYAKGFKDEVIANNLLNLYKGVL